jgi:oligopeptide transport system substrate-binding protein
MRKLMALLLAMVLVLTSAPMALAEAVLPEKAAEQIFSRVYDSEFNSLNYLYESSGEAVCNHVDTLVEYDSYGILNDCLAESWEVDDTGLVWTFHLRKGVMWYTADG